MMRSPYARRSVGCLATAALLLVCGCNSRQLRFTTMRLSETIPDLQERQVIHNFARIAANPGALPYYTVINSGTANITDNATGGIYSLFLSPRAFTTAELEGTMSRTVTGNWTLNPMSNPDRLRAMRAAYHVAMGDEFIDPVDAKRLDTVFKYQNDLSIPRGFICAGTRHEVPHRARIVAHSGKTYVWVVPGRSKEFADFSLLMMNIATCIPAVPKAQAQAGSLPQERPLPVEEGEPAPGIQMRLYEDSSGINRGLFFVPR